MKKQVALIRVAILVAALGAWEIVALRAKLWSEIREESLRAIAESS